LGGENFDPIYENSNETLRVGINQAIWGFGDRIFDRKGCDTHHSIMRRKGQRLISTTFHDPKKLDGQLRKTSNVIRKKKDETWGMSRGKKKKRRIPDEW